MTALDRTAYPVLRKAVPAQELHESFTLSLGEVRWVREQGVRVADAELVLAVMLKAHQRLAYFPKLEDVPDAVVGHVGACLDLPVGTVAVPESDRSLRRHKDLIRKRLKVTLDKAAAVELTRRVVAKAARSKNDPADLINVAIEEIVRARLELPGFTTLHDETANVRERVNQGFFEQVKRRASVLGQAHLMNLLEVGPYTRRSEFDELKQPAKRPSLSRFKAHMEWLKDLDDRFGTSTVMKKGTEFWLEDIPPAKIAHFAAEARVLDSSEMNDFNLPKRLALLACLVHVTRIRARDDLADMLIRRIATIHKKGRDKLEEIRETERAETERLWKVFGEVLTGARVAIGLEDHIAQEDPDGAQASTEEALDAEIAALHAKAGELMLDPLVKAGGVSVVSAQHADISAHHGNNYLPVLERFFKSHRKAMFDLLDRIELESTNADRAVLEAVEFIRANRKLTREFVPDIPPGKTEPLNMDFCSRNWARTIRDKDRPGVFVRRHLEVCVFSYVAAELKTGDLAVKGGDSHGNFLAQLLTVTEIEPLIGKYCAEAGLPTTAKTFRSWVEGRLKTTITEVDDGYPANSDLQIDADGKPMLRRRKGKNRAPSAVELERLVERRRREISLLDIVTRVAHWIPWWRHFGPLSGSAPKITDALGRYSVVTFTYGTNIGPAQMARHLRGALSAHEISAPGRKHITATSLVKVSGEIVDKYMGLDVAQIWGDGSKVGADGSQIDTWDDNLLAETSVRYGGYGGIVYRHIADSYIALFTRFIPCGVWEAVHLFEGLLDHKATTITGEVVHTDTQGQSLPAFGLAAMLNVDLLPRIRNWKDLTFYAHAENATFSHIGALFGGEVIDWKLIEDHWIDLMRVMISIREGKLSSATLLRKLSNESRKNRIYKAFRELGRAMRTITLLRYLSDPELRESTTAITNRVEAFHGFAKFLRFGHDGVITDNDPDHMERLVKFNELLANLVIYHNAVELTQIINQLQAEGHVVYRDDVATLSPYSIGHIRRFGDYILDTTPPADIVQPHLDLTEEPTDAAA